MTCSHRKYIVGILFSSWTVNLESKLKELVNFTSCAHDQTNLHMWVCVCIKLYENTLRYVKCIKMGIFLDR